MKGITELVFDLPKGDAKPTDAKAALLSIRGALNAEQRLSLQQKLYIRCALNLWASGKTLEQAFGLKRLKTGRPGVAVERRIKIAAEVLREFLRGRNMETAALLAGKRERVGGTQARQCWADNKLSAIQTILRERYRRAPNKHPWSRKEAGRLEALMAKDSRKRAKPVKEGN